MNQSQPTEYVARGLVEAAGLLFDGRHLSQEQLVAKILAAWSPGTRLFRIGDHYPLLWPQPQSLHAHQAPAAPLLAYGTIYSTAPLNPEQVEHFSRHPQTVLIIDQGHFRPNPLDQSTRFDPAIWINASGYRREAVKPLGRPPEKPKQDEMLMGKTTRALFKDEKLQASEEQRQILAAMKEAPTDRKGPMGGSLIRPLIGSALSALVIHLLPRRGTAGGGQSSNTPAPDATRPSFSEIWRRYLLLSQLGRFIGRRQTRYLQKMIKMFEQGDLEQALKHAIPLADLRDAVERQKSALGTPGARNNLDIPLQRQQNSSAIGLSDDSEHFLRQLYERHFRQLDRQGRYREAGFILAELLKAYDRAVDYLEQRGEKRMAAELAEGQQLAPARVIRQWLIAGDTARAIQIARLTRCYAEAVAFIQSRDKPLADQLRWHFAQLHAQSGDFEQAVELAWPLRQAHPDILHWCREATELDGQIGARMLARYLSLVSTEDSYLSKAQTLLNQTDGKTAPWRLAFIDTLTQSAATPTSRLCGRLALRSLIRDIDQGYCKPDKKRLNALLNLVEDPLLRHEARSLPLKASLSQPTQGLSQREPPLEYQVIAGTAASPLATVVIMAKGWLLVAKGESGVDLYKPNGSKVTTLAVPCHDIVTSDLGNRALLLARHNSLWVIYRFTLETLKVERWIELDIDHYAASHDGLQWLVAKGNQLWLLDLQAEEQHALWSINDLPGRVLAIRRGPKGFALLLQDGQESIATWRYQLPDLLLKERLPLSQETIRHYHPMALREDGFMAGLALGAEDQETFALFKSTDKTTPLSLQQGHRIDGMWLYGDWLAIRSQSANQKNHLSLYDLTSANIIGLPRLIVHFDQETGAYVHRFDETLAVICPQGNISLISLEDGSLISSLSVPA